MLDSLKHLFKESPIVAILLIIGFILFFIQPPNIISNSWDNLDIHRMGASPET